MKKAQKSTSWAARQYLNMHFRQKLKGEQLIDEKGDKDLVYLYQYITSYFDWNQDEVTFSGEKSQIHQSLKFDFGFLRLPQKLKGLTSKQYVCAMKFEPKQKQQVDVFKCYDCQEESNAVLCVKCFDVKKHVGHKYQLKSTIGGCCDCGDDSKWKSQSFCEAHTVDQQYFKLQMDQPLKYFLLQLFSLALKMLMYYFDAYKQRIIEDEACEVKTDIAGYILGKLDRIGSYLINIFIDMAKNYYQIHQLFVQWINQNLQFKYDLGIMANLPIKYMLLRFVELKQTSKACVGLFVVLMNRSPVLRREIITNYFLVYSQIPQFPLSNYVKLGPQLFSNSKVIRELIDEKSIKPLTHCTNFIEGSENKSQQLKQEIIKFGSIYRKYFWDLRYFLKLQEQTCKIYWVYFSQVYGFEFLCRFSEILREKDQYLKIANDSIYEIEERVILLMISIIEMMIDEKDFIIFNLKKISKKIFALPNLMQSQQQQHNLFFTMERIWGLLVFVYFFKYQQIKSIATLSKKQIETFAIVIECDEKILIQHFYVILDAIVNNIYTISRIIDSEQSSKQNSSFFKTYFYSSNVLFDIDSFMFKFILVCINGSINQQEKQTTIIELTKFQVYKSKIKECRQSLMALKLTPYQGNQRIVQLKRLVQGYIAFIDLFQQHLLCDVSQLSLLSKFANKIPLQQYHQKKLFQFYERVLQTLYCVNNMVEVTFFMKILNVFFFKQDVILPKFIKKYAEEGYSLMQDKLPQVSEINLNYFCHLRFKLKSKTFVNTFKKFRYDSFPYLENNSNLKFIMIKSQCFQRLKYLLEENRHAVEFHGNVINDIIKLMVKVEFLGQWPPWLKYFNQEFGLLEFTQIIVADSNGKKRRVCKTAFSFLEPELLKHLHQCKKGMLKPPPQKNEAEQHSFSIDLHSEYKYHNLLQYSHIEEEPFNKFPAIKLYLESSCMFLSNCICKKVGNSELYLLCYVALTGMNGVFGLNRSEQVLVLSTCGHFCHKQCYDNYNKELKGFSRCRICLLKFNKFMAFDNKNNVNWKDYQQYQIIDDFAEYKVFLKTQSLIQQALFKSLVLFLMTSVIVGEFDLFKYKILLYRSIFRKLKFIQNLQFKNVAFKFDENKGKPQIVDLFGYVTNRILLEIGAYKKKIPKPSHLQKQIWYIQQLISFFKTNELKWQIRDPLTYLLDEITLKKYFDRLVPTELSRLAFEEQQKYECINCKAMGKHSYYVCLLHNHRKQNKKHSYCYCFACFKPQQIRKHIIDRHLNQTLFLRRDTGQMYYYGINTTPNVSYQESTLSSHITQSLYKNVSQYPYRLAKGFDKRQFKLSEGKIKQIINYMQSSTFAAIAVDKK